MNLLPAAEEDLAALPLMDSRGLARHAFPDDNAPKASGLIHIAGRYTAAPDAPKAPCHLCGKSQPVALTKAPPLNGRPYAICPEREQDECMNRALIQLRARLAAAKAAAVEPEPADNADKTPGRRTTRAKAAVLKEAAEKGTGDG